MLNFTIFAKTVFYGLVVVFAGWFLVSVTDACAGYKDCNPPPVVTPTSTPTQTPTSTPTLAPTPTQKASQPDPWDCSKDHSCPPTNSAPAPDSCPTNVKPAASQYYKWLGNGKVEARWTPVTDFPYAHLEIKCGESTYSKLNVDNNGVNIVDGIPAPSCLWRVAEVSKKEPGACVGPWTEWVIDP